MIWAQTVAASLLTVWAFAPVFLGRYASLIRLMAGPVSVLWLMHLGGFA